MTVPQRMNFFVGGQDAHPFYSNRHIGKDRNKLMNRSLTPRSINGLIRLLCNYHRSQVTGQLLYIKSGGIGINITHSQDTAVP
jgi:hypothetical protein